MKSLEENIVIEDSIYKIESIFKELSSCTDAADLSQKTFDVLKTSLDVDSVSIFLMDNKTFEFIHYQTEGKNSPNTAIKFFEKLVSEGNVAEALNMGDINHGTVQVFETDPAGFVIKPLITREYIIGLLLFLTEQPVNFTDNQHKFISTISNLYTALLRNFELEREIVKIKDLAELQITERTNEIIQSSRELKIILDYLHVGIFISDRATGEIADVNLMAQKIIGQSKEDIIGKKRSDYIMFLETRNGTKNIVATSEGYLKTNSGVVLPIIHKATEITFKKEEFLIDNFLDISDRKAIENELKKTHDKLEEKVLDRTKQLTKTNFELKNQIRERIKAEEQNMKLYWAVHQSPVMIMITNIKGEIEYVNPSFIKITGYQSDEVVGKKPDFLRSGDLTEDDYSEIWESIRKGHEWKKEFRNKKKNGELFWVSSTITPVKNINDELANILFVQEDITEKKIAEQEIITAKEKAEASSRFKDILLANMSHEFRTPLITIIGYTEFLKEDLEDEEQSEMMMGINLSGIRLLKTLNNVLLVSQLDSLEEDADLVIANIPEQIEEQLSVHVMAAEVKNLKFNIAKLDCPMYARIDTSLFKQMIDNIIDNAIKYTETGSVSVSSKLINKDNRDYCAIEIKDTGIGIADENKEVIFEAFKQISEGYNRNYDGTGLGLTLAKKIVKLFEGELLLESKVDEGSTFTILLPVVNPDSE